MYGEVKRGKYKRGNEVNIGKRGKQVNVQKSRFKHVKKCRERERDKNM